MISGSKAPDYDTCGLFRALHSHNPTQYSHIVKHTLHFYAHFGAGPKIISLPLCKHRWKMTF
nr:hypothetical protein [uncultured Blautia sp.]